MGKSTGTLYFGAGSYLGHYVRNWNGLDDFRSQMEVLIENLKDPMLAVLTREHWNNF